MSVTPFTSLNFFNPSDTLFAQAPVIIPFQQQQPLPAFNATIFNNQILNQYIPSFNFSVFQPTTAFNMNFVPTWGQQKLSTPVSNAGAKVTTTKTNTNNALSSVTKAATTAYQASLKGYNAAKGQKLANVAISNQAGRSKGLCATYVKKAIQKAGLGEYITGNAWQMPSILSKNPNFKQIPVEGVNPDTLPAGCILVYGKGVSGYHKLYGHTQITTGQGTAVSDFTAKKIRKPSAIFIPV